MSKYRLPPRQQKLLKSTVQYYQQNRNDSDRSKPITVQRRIYTAKITGSSTHPTLDNQWRYSWQIVKALNSDSTSALDVPLAGTSTSDSTYARNRAELGNDSVTSQVWGDLTAFCEGWELSPILTGRYVDLWFEPQDSADSGTDVLYRATFNDPNPVVHTGGG